MQQRILPSLLLCVEILLLGVACGEKKEGALIVKVGREAIAEGDLELLVQVNPRLANRMATPAGRKQIIDNYIEQSLLYQEALKQKVDDDPLVKAKSDLYHKIILAQGLLEKRLEKEIAAYYENHRDEFEKVKIAHIYIPFKTDGKNPALDKESVVKRTQEQARALALQVADQLTKDPTQFSELAKKHSEHQQSHKRGGELGWVTVNAARFERLGWIKIAEQAFAMQEGEISAPIASDNGYHIVKVLTGKKLDSMDEAKDRIRFKIQAQIKDQLIRELKDQYTIAYAGAEAGEKEKPALPQPPAPEPTPEEPSNAPPL